MEKDYIWYKLDVAKIFHSFYTHFFIKKKTYLSLKTFAF